MKKTIYLSATSVYGNHNGKWVNEKSVLKPSSDFGKSRLIAEKRWLKLNKNSKLNLIILRLSGIYSRENNPIKRLKSGPKFISQKKINFFLEFESRIYPEQLRKFLKIKKFIMKLSMFQMIYLLRVKMLQNLPQSYLI